MRLTINQLSIQVEQRRNLMLTLLCVWLMLATSAYLHVQAHQYQNSVSKQHQVSDDGVCQQCVSSFAFSPFISTSIQKVTIAKTDKQVAITPKLSAGFRIPSTVLTRAPPVSIS